jgi:hypothetical protein
MTTLEERTIMNNNVTDTTKTDEPVATDLLIQAPISPDNRLIFQIFFLAQDQSQDVEILETEEIDFAEISERLKLGESVFIKYKNHEIVESYSSGNEVDEQKLDFKCC